MADPVIQHPPAPGFKCKVWNDDSNDWTETYKGDPITIPAKGFIVMDGFEARQLLGQGAPVVMDAQGRQIRPKALRTENLPLDTAQIEKNKTLEKQASTLCHICNKNFVSEAGLKIHINREHADATRAEVE